MRSQAKAAVRFNEGKGRGSSRHARLLLVGIVFATLAFVGTASALADVPPTLNVEPATAVAYTSAHVTGTVNPHGGPSASHWSFEYSTNPSDPGSWVYAFGGEISGTQAESNSPVTVEGDLEGLAPGTEHSIRLSDFYEEFAARVETEAPYPAFTTKTVTVPAVSISAPGAVTGSAAHFSGTIDPGAPVGNPAAFDVSWHFECTPDCPGLAGGTVVADAMSHEVSADATNLLPATSYEVRLVASNAGGQAPLAAESFTTETTAPQFSNVQSKPLETEATLEAQLNPGGLQSSYHVIYGETESYGYSTTERTLVASALPVSVKVDLFGLSSATAYHYRLIATNSRGTQQSPDQVFTTLSNLGGGVACPGPTPSPLLPDCRAYELVSPVVKNGFAAGGAIGSIGDTNAYAIAGMDGDSVMYQTTGPMADVPRGMPWYVVSRRTADGWTTHSLVPSPPRKTVDVFSDAQLAAFPSADLNSIVFSAVGSYSPDNPESLTTSGGLNISKSGVLDWLTRPTSPNATPVPGDITNLGGMPPAGGTPDLSRVFFSYNGTLLPEDDPRAPNVHPFGPSASGFYVYEDGQVKSAGRLPDGTLDPQGATAAGAVSPLFQGLNNPDDVDNQVSADGSQALFVSPDPRSGASVTQLYLYRDGQPSLLISRSSLTDAAAADGVAGVAHRDVGSGTSSYAYGSKDGGRVIFRSVDQLTADAPDDSDVKAYLFKVGDRSLTYLPDVGNAIVVAASADLHRFLFAGSSLGLWDEGSVTPISELPATSSMFVASGRATGDGSVFAFVTDSPITGFNNSDGYNEVYRYDVGRSQLNCVSCPAPGEHSAGPAFLSSSSYSPLSPTLTGQVRPTRSMSDDGSRLFFDTPTSLAAIDVNGKRDVYEWNASGTHLLSSGTSTHDSFTLDNSASGDDEFFTTTDALVPEDADGNYDVYDARVGGGFTASTAVAPCRSDCQGQPGGPPALQRPTSSSLTGPGNVRRARGSSRACKRQTKSQRRRCKARAHKRSGSKRSSSNSKGGR